MVKTKFIFLVSFICFFSHFNEVYAQVGTAACSIVAGNQLPVGGSCGSGTITDATVADALAPSCGAISRDGWFWFTATGTAHTITAITTNRQLVLQVLSGPCGGPYTEIGCGNTNLVAGPQTESATVVTVIGTTYLVRVCNQAANMMTLTSVCVSNPVVTPCTSITATGPCGTSITTNLTGAGSWNVTTCGFTTSGNEQIYSFTPTTTGTYSINVTASSGGFVDFFWMNSTTGCGSTGWTCIQDIFSPGTYGAMAWTAGQTYYILLDPEPTSATSFTWNIACPPPPVADPCTGITSIPACGTSQSISLAGTGFAGWNLAACGFSTPGDEQIYSFTAPTSGSYSVTVTSSSGSFVDYFWVNSTAGCSAGAGWNCIDDIFSAGTYGSMNFIAGQTYYILLDAESTFGISTQTFMINCPGPDPCLSILPIAACSTSTVTLSLTGAGGFNPGGCFFSTPGDDQIYSFTPTTTGNYNINISAFTGPGSVDFMYVNSTSGCSAGAGWTCIDDMFTTGNTATVNWTAGQTYYILVDAEAVGTYNLTFTINCPGTAVTASDCAAAVNVCTNLTFAVDPSGFGAINEIPALGTVGNPDLVPGGPLSPWGDDNFGCLRAGELNSTWMVVNVATSGLLRFSFGASGSCFNCYDWIMYPYNATACAQIPGGTFAPVRCNWNSPCACFTGIATVPPVGGVTTNFEPDLPVLAGQQYIICFSNYSSAFTNVPLNFFGTATVSCTPLPIELSSFNGYKKDEAVLLKWKTFTESNVSHYEIMHSTDGVNYSSLGIVVAHGSSNSSTDYDFTHSNPFFGMNYYRLVMVDANNQKKESGNLAVDFAKDELQIGAIYPNPSNGLSNMNINAVGETIMYVTITDVAGKIVSVQKLNLVRGVNKIEINTSVLSKGIYNFAVSNPGTAAIKVQKLIVE